MRMFLVVMCDMFLLLYLTAMSQMESTPVSKLTVHDYVALKKSEEEIRKLAEEREQKLAKAANESKETEIDLKAALERLRKAEKMNLSLQDQAKSAENAKADLLKKQQAEQAKAESDRIQAEKDAASAKAKAAELQTLIQKSQAESQEEKARAEELRRLAEAAKAEAERAKAEAERAKELAQQAEQEAQVAKQSEYQAQEAARLARLNEENALRTAAVSADQAAKAKVDAVRSSLLAERAEKERSKIREKLSSTTQNADRAYVKNVEGRLQSVSARIETRNLLFGRSDQRIRLSSLPVKFGDESIVFVPAEQIGIEAGRKARDFTAFDLSVEGQKVRKVYVSPRKPTLLGLVVAKPVSSASPLSESRSVSGYMPTLIAIRNGSDMNFSDRVRGLDTRRFAFQRDRLKSRADGILQYEASGFRGTGDFGERIVQGDQIVDLDGNFLGIAVDESLILPIPGLQGWSAVMVGEGSAEERVRGLLP